MVSPLTGKGSSNEVNTNYVQVCANRFTLLGKLIWHNLCSQSFSALFLFMNLLLSTSEEIHGLKKMK